MLIFLSVTDLAAVGDGFTGDQEGVDDGYLRRDEDLGRQGQDLRLGSPDRFDRPGIESPGERRQKVLEQAKLEHHAAIESDQDDARQGDTKTEQEAGFEAIGEEAALKLKRGRINACTAG